MENFLLDTHTLLWYFNKSGELSDKSFQLISNPQNQVFVSIASYWEMTIKSSLGKLQVPDLIENLISNAENANIETLGISPKHLSILNSLPFHHKDPFDRLIISQAISDGFSIIGRDKEFENYDVNLEW